MTLLKPHINIGTIGHVDHGKTTLTSAISLLLSLNSKIKKYSYKDIDSAKEEQKRGITINISHIEYETIKKHYTHIDCPGHLDYIKNMIVGATQMDYVIVVISASEGPMLQTTEHLFLINKLGIKNIIVFLNKEDLIKDEDMIELVSMEIKDLLLKIIKDVNIEIISGSAKKAIFDLENNNLNSKWVKKIKLLTDKLDNFPIPIRDKNKPFLMPIEDIFSITGRGTVITGKVEYGIIKQNNFIDLMGINRNIYNISISSIEMFKKKIVEGISGQNIGLLLRGIFKKQLCRGMVASLTKKYKTYTIFLAEIYLLKSEEGGRHTHITVNYKPQFYIWTSNITGNIKKIFSLDGEKNIDRALPGHTVLVEIELLNNQILFEGVKFTFREGKKTIGAGKISKIIQ